MHLRVNDGPNSVSGPAVAECSVMRLIEVQENVLAVPPLDARVLPHERPNDVDRLVAVLGEEVCPVPRPLFVHVV